MTTLATVDAPSTSFASFLIAQSEEALKYRLERKVICELSLAERDQEMARCRDDIGYWIDTWVDTYDPRFISDGCPAQLPFVTFERQREFLKWLSDREKMQENGSCEKSREVGVTWLFCAWGVHGLLFRPGFRMGVTSIGEEKVDKIGDMKSIFEKCRFILRWLPSWMNPKGMIDASFKKLNNTKNSASISGEVGDEVGRGDRVTVYVVDEAAYIEHPERVNAALSQTTRCQIDISTANGTHTPYYKRLRALPERQQFRFHWQDDKRKDQAWYEGECKRIGDPNMIAQELDINHAAAAVGLEFPESFFGDHVWFTNWPTNVKCKTIGIDPSRGNKDKPGCYSAIVKVLVDMDNNVWLDADMDRTRPVHASPSNPDGRSLLGDAVKCYKEFEPQGLLFEANGGQYHIVEAAHPYFAMHGVAVPPIFYIDHAESKQQRIREAFSTFLAQRRIYFRRTPGGRLLEEQTREYSAKDNMGNEFNDGPDAAATGIELANWFLFGNGNIKAYG